MDPSTWQLICETCELIHCYIECASFVQLSRVLHSYVPSLWLGMNIMHCYVEFVSFVQLSWVLCSYIFVSRDVYHVVQSSWLGTLGKVENTFLTFLTCHKLKKYVFGYLIQERCATCTILFFTCIILFLAFSTCWSDFTCNLLVIVHVLLETG